MVKIQIDNQSYEGEEDKHLLETCLSLGFDLPYFCWHPALGSVGACRQCAVKLFKDENDLRGKIVMSCMTPVVGNLRASVTDPEAQAFRKSVIEWLMINHPHDCPVCDEGGECHLQDMTLMTGHTFRRYRFNKRTFRNQDLGPFVNHEMNRCITCYRCVRFYRDYAGGRDLNAFGTHDHAYFGRHADGTLESEFSGNLVEVCPTGVFTDKTSRMHYTRKWDLQTAPSVCTHCSLGCNTIPGERYGTLRRIYNRYHPEVNGYFICDRGRYGYGFVNSEHRIHDIWGRPEKKVSFLKTTKMEVIQQLGAWLSNPAQAARTIGIGSPRASLEANFVLRSLVGAERFYHGMSEVDGRLVATVLRILNEGPVASASLREVEEADAVFILGEDLTQTAPRLALAVRQSIRNLPREISRQLKIPDWQDAAVRDAIQDAKGPLFIAAPYHTQLDEVATQVHYAAPDDLARLGFAVAQFISSGPSIALELTPETLSLARLIAEKLLEAKRPLVISGTGLRSEAVLEASANIAWALFRKKRETRICMTVPEANSLGVGLMNGKPLSDAFRQMKTDAIDAVIILENDLFRRAASELVKSFLEKAKRVILIDHVATAMTARADFILPSGPFAESDGTLINNEGRAQRFYQVFVPSPNPGAQVSQLQAAWKWLRDLMIATDGSETRAWPNFDAILADLAKSLPAFKQVAEAAPSASFRIEGEKISRQSHRYSGRTAMSAQLSVHEPKPPQDPDTPFSFSMEGFNGQPPPPLVNRYWAPGWNSVQALHKFQSEVTNPDGEHASGKRLIEPLLPDQGWFFREVPQPFVPEMNRWLILPIYHIYGSEELSRLSSEIAELAPTPYIALNLNDAFRLQVIEGDTLNLFVDNTTKQSLPVRFENTLPRGTIGLPVGLSGMESGDIKIPVWCEVSNPKLAGAA